MEVGMKDESAQIFCTVVIKEVGMEDESAQIFCRVVIKEVGMVYLHSQKLDS